MGTDIHGVFQKRNEEFDTWEDVPTEYGYERHYMLFAWLAGVRNGRGFAGIPTHTKINPISKPRGFPDDFALTDDDGESHPIYSVEILPHWQRKYGMSGPLWMGYHDFSWLTADEIIGSDEENQVLRTGVVHRKFYESWDGVSAPETWYNDIAGGGILISNPNEITDNTTHVRIDWFSDLSKEVRYFVDEVKRLKTLHGEVRFVFGFDS